MQSVNETFYDNLAVVYTLDMAYAADLTRISQTQSVSCQMTAGCHAQ